MEKVAALIQLLLVYPANEPQMFYRLVVLLLLGEPEELGRTQGPPASRGGGELRAEQSGAVHAAARVPPPRRWHPEGRVVRRHDGQRRAET